MSSNRTLRWLLVAAILACAFVTSPARADFESAVAAYERGAYQEAYREFEALADEGDQRAQPYLDRVRRKLQAGAKTGGTSTGKSSAPSDPGFDMGWSEGPSVDWSTAVTLWNPLDRRPAPPSGEEIVVPYHASVWATLFHLPADATVIVLQHVARVFDARQIYRDLQVISRNGNKISLGALAVFWWLIFLRALYGIGQFVGRLAKAVFSPGGEDTYRG